MPTKDLPKLEQELSFYAAEKLAGVELRPTWISTREVNLSDLGGDTYQTTQMLAPFGTATRCRLFMSRGVELLERRTMGITGDHLRMKLRQSNADLDAWLSAWATMLRVCAAHRYRL